MAAKFESGVTFGEMSWHGQENNLSEDDKRRYSVAATIGLAGLDWEVDKYPTMVANSPDVPQEIRGAGILDRFSVVRKSDWRVLGNVGSQYECLQNRDVFNWFQPFLDTGDVAFETAGSLAGGAIVWAMARLLTGDISVDGDIVRKYLLLSSAHDGSAATKVGFTAQRVVCWNTLSAAHRARSSKLLSVRHTSGQTDSLKAVRDVIRTVDAEFEATAGQYRRLLECKLSATELRQYVRLVLDAPDEDSAMSGRMRNQVDRCIQLATDGKGQTGQRTAWGAYNGVTEWLSHERQSDPNARQRSLWFGNGKSSSASLNRRALDVAIQLAS